MSNTHHQKPEQPRQLSNAERFRDNFAIWSDIARHAGKVGLIGTFRESWVNPAVPDDSNIIRHALMRPHDVGSTPPLDCNYRSFITSEAVVRAAIQARREIREIKDTSVNIFVASQPINEANTVVTRFCYSRRYDTAHPQSPDIRGGSEHMLFSMPARHRGTFMTWATEYPQLLDSIHSHHYPSLDGKVPYAPATGLAVIDLTNEQSIKIVPYPQS